MPRFSYDEWNLAIGRSFFLKDRADEPVYLTVDSTRLHEISELITPSSFASVLEAADDFTAAVSRAIRLNMRSNSVWFLSPLSRLKRDKYPEFLAMLALQVLAAFDMEDDEDYSLRNYWDRLADRLNTPSSAPGRASDKSLCPPYDHHQELWEALKIWSSGERYQSGRWGRFERPDTSGVWERHIALPMSQALLRRGDLQQLPAFFEKAGLLPGEALTVAEVRCEIDALRSHRGFANLFRGHARRVFEDQRADAACEQVAQFLFEWDGTTSEPTPERRPVPSPLRIWLEIRPPDSHLHGGLLAETASRGRERVAAVCLSTILGRFSYRVDGLPGLTKPFRPIHASRILAVDDGEYRVESRHARPGDQILLLIPWDAREKWDADRQAVEKPGSTTCYRPVGRPDVSGWKPLRGLPDNWAAFRLTIRTDLPRGWRNSPWDDILHHDTRLRVEGGLRLRRGVWMEGAGPALRVVGTGRPRCFWIDGKPYDMNPDGRLGPETAEVLDQRGVHEAWLSGEGRRFRIRFRVHPARVAPRLDLRPAWFRDGSGWPSGQRHASDASDTLCGASLLGEWLPLQGRSDATISDERLALDLALGASGFRHLIPEGPEMSSASEHPNPLIRNLAAAVIGPRRGCR
jgi:hypothetical protein